jgi:hypothetical protein
MLGDQTHDLGYPYQQGQFFHGHGQEHDSQPDTKIDDKNMDNREWRSLVDDPEVCSAENECQNSLVH